MNICQSFPLLYHQHNPAKCWYIRRSKIWSIYVLAWSGNKIIQVIDNSAHKNPTNYLTWLRNWCSLSEIAQAERHVLGNEGLFAFLAEANYSVQGDDLDLKHHWHHCFLYTSDSVLSPQQRLKIPPNEDFVIIVIVTFDLICWGNWFTSVDVYECGSDVTAQLES